MSKFLVKCFPQLVSGSITQPILLGCPASRASGGNRGKSGKSRRRHLFGKLKPLNNEFKIVHPNLDQCKSDIVKRQSESVFGLPSLNSRDCERRVIFAQSMLRILEKNPDLLNSILFSDEGNFWPQKPDIYIGGSEHGKLNKKRYNKKKIYAESRPLPTICWCGITSSTVIGPYFFNSHVTERSYKTMIQKFMIPQLRSKSIFETIWFQQDGAPPHRSAKVLEFLRQTFGDRLISYGTGTPIAWPAKSQDLTPLDYFLWDHLKTKLEVYVPNTHENLRECISFELDSIDPELLHHFVRDQFQDRLLKCVEANGQRFNLE